MVAETMLNLHGSSMKHMTSTCKYQIDRVTVALYCIVVVKIILWAYNVKYYNTTQVDTLGYNWSSN